MAVKIPGENFVGVGVGAFILDQNDRILLMKRAISIAVSRTTAGMWSVPGGQIDYGESAESSVVREVKEEIGVDVKIQKFIGYSDQILTRAHWVSLHFLCQITSGNPKVLEPSKCSEIKWFDAKNLPNNAGTTHVLRPAYLMGLITKAEFEQRKLQTSES